MESAETYNQSPARKLVLGLGGLDDMVYEGCCIASAEALSEGAMERGGWRGEVEDLVAVGEVGLTEVACAEELYVTVLATWT